MEMNTNNTESGISENHDISDIHIESDSIHDSEKKIDDVAEDEKNKKKSKRKGKEEKDKKPSTRSRDKAKIDNGDTVTTDDKIVAHEEDAVVNRENGKDHGISESSAEAEVKENPAVAEAEAEENKAGSLEGEKKSEKSNGSHHKHDRRRSKDRGDKDKERSGREKSKDRGKDRSGRDKSKDRGDREKDRSGREKSKERGEKDKDRSGRDKSKDRSEKDKDRSDRDRDREKSRKDDKDRDRDRERDRERSRRSRDRSYGRYERDRDYYPSHRDRERDYYRGSSGRDSRDYYREKDRDHRHSRRGHSHTRSRSPHSSRRRRRSPSDDNTRGDNKKSASSSSKPRDDEEEGGLKLLTLTDVMKAAPGISMPEAVIRMNAYNSAVAQGLTPPPITGNAPPPADGAPNLLALSQSAYNMAVGTGGGLLPVGSTGQSAHGTLPPAAANAIAAVSAVAFGIQPGANGLVGEGGAVTKPHRELYIGNLPPGVSVPQLTEFVNAAMKQLGLVTDNSPSVISTWISGDGHYAFCEVKTVELATAALTYLNGTQIGAYALKVGRPKGYSGPAMPLTGVNPLLAGAGIGGSNPLLSGGLGGGLNMPFSTETMSNVLMITSLPAEITESQIKELFTPFGELKGFNRIPSLTPGQPQSAALEYANPAITDSVVSGMNGLDIAGHKLSIQRVPMSSAAVLLPPGSGVGNSIANNQATSEESQSLEIQDIPADAPITTVIRLSNMTTDEDLTDDTLFNELVEDVSDECNSYGQVKSIVIPRGGNSAKELEGKGQIFVHFADTDSAQRSLKAVAGRRFNGRIVLAAFYPEDLYSQKVYAIPEGYFSQQNAATVAVSDEYDPDSAEFDVTPSEPVVPKEPVIMEDLD